MSERAALPSFPFPTPPELDEEPDVPGLREEAPVVRVRMADGAEVWVAAGYAAARQVFTDPRMSRAATLAPGSPTLVPGVSSPDFLLNMDPPQHSRLRRLVARAFTPQIVEQRRPRVRMIVNDLLEAMAAQGPPADLVAGLALPLPIMVICELLGISYEDAQRVRGWTARTSSVSAYPVEEVHRAVSEVLAFLAEVMAAKRLTPGDDVMTGLIEAHDGADRLTEAELVNLAHILIVAGYETTANMLALSVVTLFRHPDQLAVLRSRPELVPAAVEELVRFIRLGPAFPRVATADVEIDGVPVAAGETVFPLHFPANRDPRACPDPDRLDVTRTAAQHLSFGAGPHVCLGAPLARLELQEALAGLLRCFPGLELAVPESELRWRSGVAVRGVEALPVRW